MCLSKIWVGTLGSSLSLPVLSSTISLCFSLCFSLLVGMLSMSIGSLLLLVYMMSVMLYVFSSGLMFLFSLCLSMLFSLCVLSSIYKRRNIGHVYLEGGPSGRLSPKCPRLFFISGIRS